LQDNMIMRNPTRQYRKNEKICLAVKGLIGNKHEFVLKSKLIFAY